MRSKLLYLTAGLVATAFVAACAEPGSVLLAEWTGPYSGVPAFDQMDLTALKPALEAGMALQLEEIDAIAANPEPPTFENTILAMERAGRDLDRVLAYWGIWRGNLSTPGFREIQREMSPKLAEFRTTIRQNEALFARVRAVYEGAGRAAPGLADLRPLRP
jgi:peptidyl-dipeptidase Dcp